jgi:peptide/nickel transport system substrate-binding protein
MAESNRERRGPLLSTALPRRRLLRAAGVGVGALAAERVLAACTASAPGSGPSGASTNLRGVLSLPFSDLDPTVAGDYGIVLNNYYIYEGLYRIDPFFPRTALTPELATELPRQITPTTYRISLRESVTFHDGSPFTADDVVFTIQRMKDPATATAFTEYMDIISDVRATGTHEIELELSAPTTVLPQRLTLVRALSRAAVAASPDALKLKPVGTGPYRVASAVPNESITLSRFAGYTGKRDITYQDVRIDIISDPNARNAALQSGQAQVIDSVQPAAYKTLSSTAGLKVGSVLGDFRTYLVYNCAKVPFTDARARQALLYAVDRDAITRTVFQGQAEPAWDGEVSKAFPEYVRPNTIYRYDPAEARSLLAAAGVQAGTRIDVAYPSDIDYIAAQAQLIESNLHDIGLVPNMLPNATSAVFSRFSSGDFQLAIALGDSSSVIASADFTIRNVYGKRALTLWRWTGPKADQAQDLLRLAETTNDPAVVSGYLAELQNIIQDEVPIASLHRRNEVTGWSDRLTGFRTLPGVGFILDGVRG